MKNNINTNELIKGILIICSYFLLTNIFAIPFIFLYKHKIINEELFMILTYLSLAIFYIIIYRKNLISDLSNFKKNHKSILKTTIKYWLIGLAIMLVSSFIIGLFPINTNTNQETNIMLLKEMPIFEILLACILAPITEELVFRRSLKNFTDNDHLYALSTGITFGLIHILSSISNPNDYLMYIYLIPYSSVGIAFGYAYKKTNNIYGTIIVHSIHNLIALLEIIILGGLL